MARNVVISREKFIRGALQFTSRSGHKAPEGRPLTKPEWQACAADWISKLVDEHGSLVAASRTNSRVAEIVKYVAQRTQKKVMRGRGVQLEISEN